MGLTCPNKRGDVRWVLRTFCCDTAVLQESKEEVNLPIAISLWGHRSVDWVVLPSGSFWQYRDHLGSLSIGVD